MNFIFAMVSPYMILFNYIPIMIELSYYKNGETGLFMGTLTQGTN